MIPQTLPLLCAPLKLPLSAEGLLVFPQVLAQESPPPRVTLTSSQSPIPELPSSWEALSSLSFPAGFPSPDP